VYRLSPHCLQDEASVGEKLPLRQMLHPVLSSFPSKPAGHLTHFFDDSSRKF
jgi:hypothetical protein